MRRLLVRAQLPPEVLALAYNILCGLNCHSLPAGSFYSAPSDLLVVAVLSLASSYTSDHPPSFLHWSRGVCNGTWTAIRIDETALLVLAALDWRLHEFSTPSSLEHAMARLSRPVVLETSLVRSYDPIAEPELSDFKTNERLEIVIEETSACWMNGQITPGGTPPSSAWEGDRNQFLRLL